jgi:hypothetical protein
VYVCVNTSYKVEEILDKNAEWLKMIVREISSIEFERNMQDLMLHGASKKEIDKMRNDFYEMYTEKRIKSQKKIDRLPSIKEFRNLGLSVGKPNKTAVKR